MAKSDAKAGANPVWNLFKSVKFTIFILIVLAIASIVGTLIPQQEGAFDMYHALWFRLIIAALALNLIVCSIDRFPATWKRLKALPKPDRTKPFENLPSERSFSIKGPLNGTADRLSSFMKARYRNVREKHTGKDYFIYGDKGRYSRLGVYIIHLSVLLIIVGGIIGSLFGFQAFVSIPEGQSIAEVTPRGSQTPRKLPFQIRCEKFFVDFYHNGEPKEFRSDLQFFENGKLVQKGSLLVNHPITFRGITFYQASYGKIPGDKVRIKISRKGNDHESRVMVVPVGKSVDLPAKDGRFQVVTIIEDFMRMGPAMLIKTTSPQGEEKSFWVFQRQEMIGQRFPGIFEKFPKLNPASYSPYVFHLMDFESRYYTGLEASRDPGVFFVWLGCFLMIGGFLVTFFLSHRQFWVRIKGKEKKLTVSVAGNANKNPLGLERDLNRLVNKLRHHLADEG